MMWLVVHFFNDESVEAVPDTWLKKNKCAWPADRKNIKRYIEKRVIPNQLEFAWFPARKLGNAYSSLESARAKSKVAQYSSDLSTNEEIQMIKSEETRISIQKNHQSKRIASPPTLKIAGLNKKFKLMSNNAERSESEEETYDSDKDPEYVYNPHVKDNGKKDTNKEVVDFNNISESETENENDKTVKKNLEYYPECLNNVNTSPVKLSTTSVKSLNIYNTPVKSTHSYNTPVKSQNTFNNYYIKSPIGKILVENNDPLTSITQNYFSDSSSQPVMKTHAVDETMKISKRVLFMSEPSQKNVKDTVDTVLISKTNTKSKINKKKEDGYLMHSADAIRVHPKFKSLIDKEFDVPLATWLAHAKYRMANKNNTMTSETFNNNLL